jgi:AraC family transcriptional regulator
MAQNYEKRMLRVLDYIRENLDGDLSLDALADVAAMSRFHWHRVFRAMYGANLAEAVRFFRLHRAACWLVQTDRPLADISRAAGYGGTRSFGHAFAAEFGLSPAAFRERGALAPSRQANPIGGTSMYPVDVSHTPARRLAALAHQGPYLEIGSTFGKLGAVVAARNLGPEVKGMIAVYYDDPNAVAAEKLRSHAGVVIGESTALPQGLDEVRLAAGEAAVLHYKGPYAGLMAAYDYLFGKWLPHSGREAADRPCFEVYHNTPADTAPADLLTDIVVPLA